MIRPLRRTLSPPGEGEPVWDFARLYPLQGCWREEDYLDLDLDSLVEFTDGRVEFLPMPTTTHQVIAAFLFNLLTTFVSQRDLGLVLFAPLRVRVRPGKVREPDIVFMAREHADRIGEQYWDGADLVMEVVSPDDPDRDLVTKRRDYAEASIPEYWVVDPRDETVRVLALEQGEYIEASVARRGEAAESRLLPGFRVEAEALFAAARRDGR